MKAKYRFMIVLLGLLLVACSSAPTPEPQPVFTQAPEVNSPSRSPGNVVASGVVKPGQQAALSFAQGGWVQTVLVSEGDTVEAGELIAQLEGRERLEASISAAETEVLAAQQALDRLAETAGMDQALAYQAIIAANQAVGMEILETLDVHFDQPRRAQVPRHWNRERRIDVLYSEVEIILVDVDDPGFERSLGHRPERGQGQYGKGNLGDRHFCFPFMSYRCIGLVVKPGPRTCIRRASGARAYSKLQIKL